MDFLFKLKQKVKKNPANLVLPEGTEPRILKAAGILIDEKIVSNIILAGDKTIIEQQAAAAGVSLRHIQIQDPVQSDLQEDFIREYYDLRKQKGVSLEDAREFMKKPVNWGAMLVRKGFVNAMVAGAVTSTAEVLQAALRIIRTSPGTKFASSCFVMCHPDKSLGSEGQFIFSDCAIIPDPDAEQLAEIAIAAARSCRELLDAEPKVAMLSFSTYGSADHPQVDKVRKATELVKTRQPELMLDGELQADAALVPEVSRLKCRESAIKGRANVLIFPNLAAGNIGYKLVQRLANANAYGPFLQGFNKPVSDLSRGCSVEDVVNTAIVTLAKAIG